MPESTLDLARLHQALELARESFGLTEPNPRVGCIIGQANGEIAGQGATQQAGAAHAEIMALRHAQASGISVRGATAWVTLEPCAHFGRTPPCCDALIDAGIGRCVIAVADPFPKVAGAGMARMRAAGIAVDLVEDVALVEEARDINVGFFSRIERGMPWVRMKIAASADGQLALRDGQSKWITGEEARADGHRWRRRASAVLTGIGTVLADDPRLDVRMVPTAKQPLRIVLDSRLRLPPNAALLQPPGTVLVVAAAGQPALAEHLRAQGAEVWDDWPRPGMPTLRELLVRLAACGHNELHIEAGPRLNGALLEAGVVDELLIYLAPLIIGPGLPIAVMSPLTHLSEATRFRWSSVDRVGADVRLRMRR